MNSYMNIVIIDKKRYYQEDLSKRDYTLECTTPYKITLLGDTIECGSWVELLTKVSKLLLAKFPEKLNDIYKFSCPWSKQKMIDNKESSLRREIAPNVYLSCNHSAVHLCWILQDLLDFFGVDKSTVNFLIHRTPAAENDDVKKMLEESFKKDFNYYIISKYGKDTKYVQKQFEYIDKYLNPILSSKSKSYPNFYLFDNVNVYYNYAKLVREYINSHIEYGELGKKVLNRCLDHMLNFYKSA